MDSLDISILIPVADDVNVKKCIGSIDENAEVVLALNGATREIEDIAKDLKVKYCEIPDRNLSMALDVGIRACNRDKVLLMDSDCTFEKNCIKLLWNGLRNSKLAKGRVVFLYDSFISKVIAKTREYHTSDEINAYAPPLALRKDIINDIGGYYYDRDIHWVEDAEFDDRIEKMGIKINYLAEAIIYHPPISVLSDLRSAFRYGIGKRIGVEKGIMHGVGSYFSCIFDIATKKGILPSFYFILWNLTYLSGYLTQLIFDPYGVRKRLNANFGLKAKVLFFM